MTKKTTILLGAMLLLCLSGCKSEYETLLMSNDVDAKYAAAFDYFNQKKYAKAASMFESMTVLVDGTEREDTVRYYWGLSNYRDRDYITAETNFSRFLEKFPMGSFSEDAAFMRLDCLFRSTYRYELDQGPTRACIIAINEFVKEHPGSRYTEACFQMVDDLTERLDRKALEEGKLYYNMEYYKSAHVDFKNMLKKNADNVYREEILYYTALSSYKYAYYSIEAKQRERYLVFVDDYLNFIGEYPDSGFRRELDGLYKAAQRAIGRNAASAAEETPAS